VSGTGSFEFEPVRGASEQADRCSNSARFPRPPQDGGRTGFLHAPITGTSAALEEEDSNQPTR
jgi:hypothetical protein